MNESEKLQIEVDVERLDADIIDEHLRNSTVVLRDILKDSDVEQSSVETNDGLICQYCGKIYKTNSTLQAHYLLVHPKNEIEGHCVSCDKVYPSLLSLQKHVRYMHRYKHRCEACYRNFATAELLCVHSEECKKCENPCSQCNKVFDSQLALKNHIKYKHPNKTKYWCEICRRTFTTNRRLINHNATIHPPGTSKCNWCNKPFNTITSLQTHILYKHTENRAKCHICRKVFAKQSNLLKHLSKNHYIQTVTDNGN